MKNQNIGKMLYLAVGENQHVTYDKKVSLICKNCNQFSYDIRMDCRFSIENEQEIIDALTLSFPSPLYPVDPYITNKIMFCPVCKSVREFCEVPRDFKELVKTVSLKGYRVTSVHVPHPFGTGWNDMSVTFEPITQYNKVRGLNGLRNIKAQQTLESTILYLDPSRILSEFGESLVSTIRIGKGSHEKVFYQVDDINKFPEGTYETWYNIFVKEIREFIENLPKVKVQKTDESDTLINDIDERIIRPSGKIYVI